MRWLLVALSLLLLGSSARADAPTLRDFSDWHVMCTDTFYCNADTDSGGDTAGKLQILRDASAVYWSFVFVPTNATIDTSAAVTVTVDDFAQTFIGAAEVAPYGAANNYHFLGTGAQAVVDKLAAGKTLTISFFDPKGVERKAEFSLAGLTASLIFIDEFQTRLGSERVAGVAPEGMTVFGAEPEVPQRLLEALAADPQCRPMSELANGGDIETDLEFGAGQKLYILPCWAAAYNFGSKVYVEIFEGEFAEASFPEFSEEVGWTATNQIINYSYHPETETLNSYYKGRGLGDCGTSGTWQWHEYQFRLIEYRNKPDCDETGSEFPVVYTAPALPGQPATPAEEPIAPVALLKHIGADSECGYPTLGAGDVITGDLDGDTMLWLVYCRTDDTGQVWKAYAQAGGMAEFRVLAVPQFVPGKGWTASTLLHRAEFSQVERSLSITFVPGTDGTCGATAKYIWETPGFFSEARFRLEQFRANETCGGGEAELPVVFDNK